jgi:hypothetical protein
MIEITKSEAKKIRDEYPQVSISRTMKQNSNRGKRYCPELDKYLELIADTNDKAKEILEKHRKQHLRFYQN